MIFISMYGEPEVKYVNQYKDSGAESRSRIFGPMPPERHQKKFHCAILDTLDKRFNPLRGAFFTLTSRGPDLPDSLPNHGADLLTHCPSLTMGKTRPPSRVKLARKHKRRPVDPSPTPQQLLTEAASLLEQSDASSAYKLASSALKSLKSAIKADEDAIACLPALCILGEACVELGDIAGAQRYFTQAAEIDPDGEISESKGGGPDKFLWLAQLSEEGGQDAVKWFEKAAKVLRGQISELEDEDDNDSDLEEEHNEGSGDSELIKTKKNALASALCAITEIYMTDLSLSPDAESACSKAMEEALQVAPNDPETLQTVASVRISQDRRNEAQKYLRKSLSLWEDLEPGDAKIPSFAVRISLARLLMEAEMEEEAYRVVESLVVEDDTSVETWYLGGFAQYLLAKRTGDKKDLNGSTEETAESYQRQAQQWLQRCLKLYQQEEYEDDRLRDHATELLRELSERIGEPGDENDDEEWEDEEGSDSEGDEDEDMEDG
jgi:tetratricopeptide (TPR) repeat protein